MKVGDLVYAPICNGHLPRGAYGCARAGVGVFRVKEIAKSTDSFKVEYVSGHTTYGGNRSYNRLGEFFRATYEEAWQVVHDHLYKSMQTAEEDALSARRALADFEAKRETVSA